MLGNHRHEAIQLVSFSYTSKLLRHQMEHEKLELFTHYMSVKYILINILSG